jgi:hypothetical protein
MNGVAPTQPSPLVSPSTWPVGVMGLSWANDDSRLIFRYFLGDVLPSMSYHGIYLAHVENSSRYANEPRESMCITPGGRLVAAQFHVCLSTVHHSCPHFGQRFTGFLRNPAWMAAALADNSPAITR